MKVSNNKRFLILDDGTPFFYLADTAWALFYKPTLKDATRYLENRREKGFTVIMPVLLWREDTDPQNPNGDLPLLERDPAQPNDRFFDHVEQVVDVAESLGLHMAVLPTWGEFVGPIWHGKERSPNFDPTGKGPEIFTEENAREYGAYIARRFGSRSVTWVLGGDRLPVDDHYVAVWRAMAEGLSQSAGTTLMTYHPCGVYSSSEYFHNESWLDFNMMQTTTRWDFDNYRMIREDYQRSPAKPVVDGETRYEDSYERFTAHRPCGRRVTPHQVRKAAYNAMLSGAMGHTYGCRDVWYFHDPEASTEPPRKDVKTHWRRAMDFGGAWQMGYFRTLFTRYSWHELVPDIEERIIVRGSGTGGTHIPAAISEDGRFLVAYFPEQIPAWVDTAALAGTSWTATWFDPRTGTYHWDRDGHGPGEHRFHPPSPGSDAVLILEGTE